MSFSSLTIKHLIFTGHPKEAAKLNFKPGLNLLYGASNTGKSFALKALDFMLGATKLPDLPESIGYQSIWLGFTLKDIGDFTLYRSIKGGDYELYKGLIEQPLPSQELQTLAATKKSKVQKSLSVFLLEKLNLSDKKLAKNASGVTEEISFRDIAPIALVDEASIQDERSPIESGQHISRTKERSLFRLLLSGLDDSSIVAVEDDKTFTASKNGKIAAIKDILDSVEKKLRDYSDFDGLHDEDRKNSIQLEKAQSEFDSVQGSISELLTEKQRLSIQIPRTGERLEEVEAYLERFSQLNKIYTSDIDRLESLEEASFLMSLEVGKDCDLCGAITESQKISHDVNEISLIQQSALIEIEKINSQRKDLHKSIEDLKLEREILVQDLESLKGGLNQIEGEISLLTPNISKSKKSLHKIIRERDFIKAGLSLLEQKNLYMDKINEFSTLKKPSKKDRPVLKTSDSLIYELCTITSSVLREWDFPGNCDVSFNDKSYDLMIDGKLRINNGKGVRAVTHAAFKVALLIFCRDNDLPHPGFIVFDTPLLTYRDPLKNKNAEALTEDEERIAKSSLKEKFFKHLASIEHLGQFIIIENIDPPENIEEIAHVQTFFGNDNGARNGLFPV